MENQVDANKVIHKLTQRIATLELEKAMLQVALDETNEKGVVKLNGNSK